MTRSAYRHLRGFSLIELAVVITIVAILLGALLVPLATQFQSRNVRETQLALKEIKEALMGFAVTQGRLPCPDTDRDGLENAPCGVYIAPSGQTAEGFLPWQDLAVTPTDAWGHVFRYVVSSEFTYTSIPGTPPATDQLDLTDDLLANIRVITRGDNPALGAGGENKEVIQLTTTALAVVLSVGSNGLGGSPLGGPDLPLAPAGTDELINVPAILPGLTLPPPPRLFVQRTHTPPNAGCSETNEAQPFCEYDDILIWLSAPALLNRMVEARQLP